MEVVAFFGEAPEFARRVRVHGWLRLIAEFLLLYEKAVATRRETVEKQRRKSAVEKERARRMSLRFPPSSAQIPGTQQGRLRRANTLACIPNLGDGLPE